MLNMDATERITPSEVLSHPFIAFEPSQELSATAPKDNSTDNTTPDHHSQSPKILPEVIMIQRASPENTSQLEDEENADRRVDFLRSQPTFSLVPNPKHKFTLVSNAAIVHSKLST